jgi:hypothetical protein
MHAGLRDLCFLLGLALVAGGLFMLCGLAAAMIAVGSVLGCLSVWGTIHAPR